MTFDTIIKQYVKKIKAGKITINDVPEKWRDAVKAALNAVQ